jgi:Ca2+-binding EF-hand superfamily protein
METLKTLKKTISIQGKLYEVDLSKIPAKDIEKLKASFNELDEDKSGHIGVEEIMDFLEGCGLPSSRQEVLENYYDDIDKDNDYQLDFVEFVMRFAPRTELIKDKVVDAFRNFAPSKSKFIDVRQLKRVLITLGEQKFSEQEFESALKYLNLEENDTIEFEEFVEIWREKAKVFD